MSAREAVEKVRQRAKLNPYQIASDINQDEFRALVKNERRVELSFEDQRYFDLRRWKDAESVLNKDIKGFKITASTDSKTYETIVVDDQRTFEPKMYFSPIPYKEQKVLNIEQNPGW